MHLGPEMGSASSSWVVTSNSAQPTCARELVGQQVELAVQAVDGLHIGHDQACLAQQPIAAQSLASGPSVLAEDGGHDLASRGLTRFLTCAVMRANVMRILARMGRSS